MRKNPYHHEQQRRQIDLPIGTVRIVGFTQDIPEGWQKMRIDEGREYKQQISRMLNAWSIIAFQIGALVGSGYGRGFWEHYGGQCGEGFIIKRKIQNN